MVCDLIWIPGFMLIEVDVWHLVLWGPVDIRSRCTDQDTLDRLGGSNSSGYSFFK